MADNKEVIEAFVQRSKEWEEYLLSETDVNIIMIEEKDVQFDKISKEDFEALSVMLDLGLEEELSSPAEEVVEETVEETSEEEDDFDEEEEDDE